MNVSAPASKTGPLTESVATWLSFAGVGRLAGAQ